MKYLDRKFKELLGADRATIISVVYVAGLTILASVTIVLGIIMLITDPGTAETSTWGFPD